MAMHFPSAAKLKSSVEPVLRAARIPGAAIAVVVDDEIVYVEGYGYRDLQRDLQMTGQTAYPIATTGKAFTTTLLGMLVEEGLLGWDIPVQRYLPAFQLCDPLISTQVTVRDLVTMRTGLANHNWLWMDQQISRAELVARVRHLDLSSGLRERMCYSNLTAAIAGHVAEVVTGHSWEELVRERILQPLQMTRTVCGQPAHDEITVSYYENSRRELLVSGHLHGEVAAPAGSTMYSTVSDIARWMSFNLNRGQSDRRQYIDPRTLAEIHSPQVLVHAEPTSVTSPLCYALGWFVDSYRGHRRLSHSGYHHHVHSDVMLFPDQRVGIVAFTNFGPPALAKLVNECIFDAISDAPTTQAVEQHLARYETAIKQLHRRNASLPRASGTTPSHALDSYCGDYIHPAYGHIAIRLRDQALILQRNNLMLPLEHWHYDRWVVADNDLFAIHLPHAFDRAGGIHFETQSDGQIGAMSIALEPTVSAIRFKKAASQ